MFVYEQGCRQGQQCRGQSRVTKANSATRGLEKMQTNKITSVFWISVIFSSSFNFFILLSNGPCIHSNTWYKSSHILKQTWTYARMSRPGRWTLKSRHQLQGQGQGLKPKVKAKAKTGHSLGQGQGIGLTSLFINAPLDRVVRKQWVDAALSYTCRTHLSSACTCWAVGHMSKLCRNRQTDQDAVGGQTRVNPRNVALDRGPDLLPTQEGEISGSFP